MKTFLDLMPAFIDSSFMLILPLIGAVLSRKEATCTDPGIEKVRDIFIPQNELIAQQGYFNKVKKPLLDAYVRGRYPGVKEKTEFHFRNAGDFTNSLRSILQVGGHQVTGVRIYFGSYEKDPSNPGADIMDLTDGQLMLILTPTRLDSSGSGKHKSIGRYWVINDARARLDEYPSNTVQYYIEQYKNGKMAILRQTLAQVDVIAGRSETYSVFFNKKIIEALCNEIDYQVCMQANADGGITLGVKVKLLSYDDNAVPAPPSTGKYKLMQRLTVHFVLTNESLGGKELDMAVFDQTRYSSLVIELGPSSWNTGNPTPPFPNEDQ